MILVLIHVSLICVLVFSCVLFQGKFGQSPSYFTNCFKPTTWIGHHPPAILCTVNTNKLHFLKQSDYIEENGDTRSLHLSPEGVERVKAGSTSLVKDVRVYCAKVKETRGE